jgi:membrane associated rhomboid family serine protease
VRGTGYVPGGGMNISYQLTPWVKKLLIANTVAFLVTMVVGREFIFNWFSFQPSEFFFRPWGAVTYMFLHGDFMHLFGNMLVLFFFGPPLESKWGSDEFIKYYMICGMGGVFLSLFFVSYSIIGASAAVYGVMMAFAMAWPDAPIYFWGIFPIKAKYLVAFFFLITFTSAFGGAAGGVAHFAHLGGFITGFLYLKTDWKAAQQIQKMSRAARSRRFAIVPRDDKEEEEAAGGRGRDIEAEQRESTMLDAVDKVLDKISAEGMSSLTDDERRLLDEVSKKHRTN